MPQINHPSRTLAQIEPDVVWPVRRLSIAGTSARIRGQRSGRSGAGSASDQIFSLADAIRPLMLPVFFSMNSASIVKIYPGFSITLAFTALVYLRKHDRASDHPKHCGVQILHIDILKISLNFSVSPIEPVNLMIVDPIFWHI
jgi:hypothetical protein